MVFSQSLIYILVFLYLVFKYVTEGKNCEGSQVVNKLRVNVRILFFPPTVQVEILMPGVVS